MEIPVVFYWAAAMLPVNLFNLMLYDDLCGWAFRADSSRRRGWPFGCAAGVVMMTMVDLLPAPWWVNALLTALLLGLITVWFYDCFHTGKRLLTAGLFLLLIALSDTAGQRVYLFMEPGAAGWPGPLRRVAGIFICLLVIFMLVKSYIRATVEIYREISIGWFLMFLIVPLACLICCLFMSWLLAKYAVSAMEEFALILSGAALLLACRAAFTLFERLVGQMELNREYNYIRLRREMENTHYDIIQQKNDEYAGMLHDIKHHLRYLSQLAAGGDLPALRQYLSDLQQDLSSRAQGIYTDDKILNVILCEKAEQARRRGVDFQVELTASISFLNPMDACTLMGNLLDNAIEGAENAPGEKYVRLKIRAFNSGFTVIRVENSFNGQLKLRHNRLLSTKSAGHHGYGMRSIEQIAEKTGGSMEYKAEKQMFQTTVLLNMILPFEE
ncbi:MAG: GHKL domain-containing protein [Oscillospiraceae bacterium]|jgi:two-component system sensor histidine kinase AgrC|nr:GHKL domain-containing protein [Oscillospiraceae bacterium]